MKLDLFAEPREALAIDGQARSIGEITLASDEQVTFATPGGAEYDVAPKDWGLYATPSLGARLPRFQLRAAFVRSAAGLHLMLVEVGKESEFEQQMSKANITIEAWVHDGVADYARSLSR